MPDSAKRSQEYKDFRFRRRYDHFLRFRLSSAQPEEIISTAFDLGFNLNIKDLRKKKQTKTPPSQSKPLFSRLRSFFQA